MRLGSAAATEVLVSLITCGIDDSCSLGGWVFCLFLVGVFEVFGMASTFL